MRDDLIIANPDRNQSGAMNPSIVLETGNGVRINTGLTYEDVERIEAQSKGTVM